jgi:hypothetical protein
VAETKSLLNLAPLAVGYVAAYGLPNSSVVGFVQVDLDEDDLKVYSAPNTSKYILRAGDPRYPVRVYVTSQLVTPKDGPAKGIVMRKSSMRVWCFIKHVETDTIPDTTLGIYPATAVIAWDMPHVVNDDAEFTRRILDLAYFMTHGQELSAVAAEATIPIEGPLFDLAFGSSEIQVLE